MLNHDPEPTSIWGHVADAVEHGFDEAPRARLLHVLLRIRKNMEACQKWYDLHKQVQAGDETDFRGGSPEVEWLRALAYLASDMHQFDSVITIFSPRAREVIGSYLGAESLAVGALGPLGAAAEDLGAEQDFDIKTIELRSSFAAALRRFDCFIRERFTPEEVFAAGKARQPSD